MRFENALGKNVKKCVLKMHLEKNVKKKTRFENALGKNVKKCVLKMHLEKM